MLKNIYTPLAGAISQERALEMIANNLANVNTVGFKGDNVTFTLQEPEPYKNYPDPLPPANFKQDMSEVFPLRGNEMSYVGVAAMHKDMSQGPAQNTQNPYDLMIEGQGFLAAQTSEGVRYTRAGNLTVSQDGVLVTKQGDPVMGEKGLIYVRGTQFEVNTRGEVFQDGQLLDRLKLVNFQNPQDNLERVGNNYYQYAGREEDILPARNASIRQGFLEGSNVNAIKNLTSMIIAHRSYEAYQKAVSNYDQIMEKSSNAIGDVRA
ncbi:MAG TPA: flagellar basal-body rod protein FlgF [Oligoflexus sp.]|jgi:flagellar basal-body rod protein FlgG|uniref:flagellar basal-body rod protein FlgF n=1 Tax=Oligoflexus sp. TaxID=1971216 RepID=UPI002D7F7185|nr:flagellar basal-body rod protein FlgF [Oligoflexus sp.]HET9240469.1 flagellar basal-body rod protein FlgF [Oligoflexus sp.]